MTLTMHVLHVVGARPNFMKLAPVHRALAKRGIQQSVIHTGQHYDENMAGVFFRQLGIPQPEEDLAVGSSTHAQQTAAIISGLEPVLLRRKPDAVLVYGDVNSTVAAALVCAKLQLPIAHVEAGLRSFDRTMPEEINRLVTDQLSDLLFTPSSDGNENLEREGIPHEKIVFVGNVMIDTLVRLLPLAVQTVPSDLPRPYALLTLHRPSNVDDPQFLQPILETLSRFSREMTIFFPLHPRTRKKLTEFGLNDCNGRLRLMDPLPYLEFLGLQQGAACVITDSGGIQEEATFLGVPCLTVRENTERPVTVSCGTNILVGRNMHVLAQEVRRVLSGQAKSGSTPDLWDGKAAERIADTLLHRFGAMQEARMSCDAIASS